MLQISRNISIPDDAIHITAIRAQGPGGQHVNKVASAIQLRFDIRASSLPEEYKQRLLTLRDKRISKEGVIILKAQRFRTQERNREDALERLTALIRAVTVTQKNRRPTKATQAARKRRLDGKNRRGRLKKLRGKVSE